MSEKNSFKTIKELTQEVDALINLLNSGKLGMEGIEALHACSRELYERITLVRYKAMEKEANPKFAVLPPTEETLPTSSSKTDSAKKKEKKGVAFKLNVEKEEKTKEDTLADIAVEQDEASKHQISLLDEIEARSSEKSLNEKFAQSKTTLGDKLKKQPIKNLKDSIGLNQKFLFMNDLFHGENAAYNDAVETLNSFSDFTEARAYIVNELSEKYKWDGDSESVVSFMELVERRYLG